MIKNETTETGASKMTDKILIGGQALREIGSDRHTDDVDYLVSDAALPLFSEGAEGDLINAAGHNFLSEIYETEKGKSIASPQALAELKGWAFVQHCQNYNFAKADACEYDLAFLAREHGITNVPVLTKYEDCGPVSEVVKILTAKGAVR